MGAGIKDAVNKSALNKKINFTFWEWKEYGIF